ncbi:AAA family ATPase [Macrococcus carouselicus]|nr:SMC family ATPase [Macrococcus carouselicus]
MKPIKLELKNFGPFLDETIHFNELNQQQLFLVSGRTGSGKTILFDAMTYALYGEASTKDRDKNALRSQFAGNDEIASVRFTFTVSGSTYVAERQLPYWKTGNKKMTESKFQLMDITDEKKLLAAKTAEGKQAVLDIMKVDANQFRQILILPQGEFKRFLVSSSKEKQPVLRTLFNTVRFRLLEDKLLTETKELESAVHTLEEKLYALLGQIKADATVEGSIGQQLAGYQSIVNEQQQQLEQLSLAAAELTEKLNAAQTELEAARQVNALIALRAELTAEKNELISQHDAIQDKKRELVKLQVLETLSERYSQLQKMTAKIGRWSEEMTELSATKEKLALQLAADKKELHLLVENEAEMSLLTTRRDDERHYLNDDIWQQLEQQIRDSEETIKTLSSQIQETEMIAGDVIFSQMTANNDRRQRLSDEIMSGQQQLTSSKNELKEKQAQNDSFDRRLQYEAELKTLTVTAATVHADAINLLRQHLHTGDVCPVCQQIIQDMPDRAEATDRLEMMKEQARQKVRLESLIEALSDVEQADTRRIMNRIRELESYIAEKLEAKEEADKEQEQLQLDFTAAIDGQEKRTKLENKLEQVQYELMSDKEKWQGFKEKTGCHSYDEFAAVWSMRNEQIIRYNERKEELQKRIDAHINELKINSSASDRLSVLLKDGQAEEEAARSRLTKEMAKYKITEEQLAVSPDNERPDKLEHEIERYEQALTEVTIRLKTLEDQIQGQAYVDTEQLAAHAGILKEDQMEIQEQETTLKIRLEDNRQLLAEIEKIDKDYRLHVEEQKELLELSRLLGGKNQHNLTLENYVLTYYLDQTLKLANLRLKEMTGHRYQFRRSIIKSLGYSGLDIEIFDQYSNQVRDITTLSGGETFLASLSLALGLSDYVTQLSGGISLESVFIDEGFGTLDNETLETAIECLVELERSGKMVGLISHVPVLKDRIPAILHVESSGYLSTTHFTIK